MSFESKPEVGVLDIGVLDLALGNIGVLDLGDLALGKIGVLDLGNLGLLDLLAMSERQNSASICYIYLYMRIYHLVWKLEISL